MLGCPIARATLEAVMRRRFVLLALSALSVSVLLVALGGGAAEADDKRHPSDELCPPVKKTAYPPVKCPDVIVKEVRTPTPAHTPAQAPAQARAIAFTGSSDSTGMIAAIAAVAVALGAVLVVATRRRARSRMRLGT
jgi:hypothetical protein